MDALVGSARGRPLFRVDPGWLFLLPGLVILSATVLIPASDDLERARAHREKALALETHRSERLGNHLVYLDALERRDETVLLALAASQLNLAPADREVIIAPAGGGATGRGGDASVLATLEAEYVAPMVTLPPDSLLHRVTTNRHARLWLIAGAAMSVLYGVLPPAHESGARRRRRRWRWEGLLVAGGARRRARGASA